MRRWWTVVVVVGLVLPATGAGAASLPEGPACPMFPADSYWHARVDRLPVDPASDTYVANAGATSGVHADFGAGLYDGGPIGIPYTTVVGTQPKVPVGFDYADESDPGPYPIPPNAPIEGGAGSSGDRHVLVVDRDACRDYEVYAAYPLRGGAAWSAGSGAVFDLGSNAMRPATWTSADAAGLPILPGLVRYDEVASGEIDHAIRITLRRTDRRYVWPARHQAGSADPTAAPMGAWLRLKPDVDLSRLGPQARVVARALQQHGAIVADNGSSWYLSGAPDSRWDNDDLHGLGALHGSDFEFVDPSSLVTDPNSGRVTTAPARSDVAGGLTVDGFGGLHRFRVGTGARLAAPRGAPAWPGWDIARGVALLPDHSGGYVLDGFGGLHPFAIGTDALPPAARGTPYWPGWDIARGVTVLPDGSGGYVVDGFGGLHPFRIGRGGPPPAVTTVASWPGRDVARGVALRPDGRSGYVVTSTGVLARVAFGGAARPPGARGTFRPATAVMRGVVLLPDGTGGYTLDDRGGLHPFAVGATAPVAPPTAGAATWTWSIARGVGL
ncbi:MAG: hypothetical protein ACXVJX_07715 [Acidimicrobiia bacterium]